MNCWGDEIVGFSNVCLCYGYLRRLSNWPSCGELVADQRIYTGRPLQKKNHLFKKIIQNNKGRETKIIFKHKPGPRARRGISLYKGFETISLIRIIASSSPLFQESGNASTSLGASFLTFRLKPNVCQLKE